MNMILGGGMLGAIEQLLDRSRSVSPNIRRRSAAVGGSSRRNSLTVTPTSQRRLSLRGGLDKLTGSSETKDTTKVAAEEDPEVIQAKLEAEEQRKEKHRRMEDEREKLRNNIRDKYGLQKAAAEESTANQSDSIEKNGLPGSRPSDGGLPKEEAGLIGQVTGLLDKAKTQVTGVVGTVKGLLPFGK